MIDIHTHILPKVDDGPSTWEESIEMLKGGQKDGIKEIALTPHILSNFDYNLEKEIRQRFAELKRKTTAAGIRIKLHLGSEIYLQPETNLNHGLSTFNENGKHFLVEFPMSRIPEYASQKLFELIMDGFIPVLAHPERNAVILRNPSRAYQLVQMGTLIQINSGSLTGDFGQSVKATAFDLIEHNLVHFVASDCHDADSRPLALKEAKKIVEENWGSSLAKLLFVENPRKLLRGQKISPPEPIAFEERPKRSFNPLKIFRRWKVKLGVE